MPWRYDPTAELVVQVGQLTTEISLLSFRSGLELKPHYFLRVTVPATGRTSIDP